MTSPITSQPVAGLQSTGDRLQEVELEPERKKKRSCFARFCCGVWDGITECPDNCGDCIEACCSCCDDDTGKTNRRHYNDDDDLNNVWVAHGAMADCDPIDNENSRENTTPLVMNDMGSAQDTDYSQPNHCTPSHHGSSHNDTTHHGSSHNDTSHHGSSHHDSGNHGGGGGGCDIGGGDTGGDTGWGDSGGGDSGGGGCDD